MNTQKTEFRLYFYLLDKLYEQLSAKLNGLQKANCIPLIGDNLRLPDDGDGQQSHKKYAKGQGNIGVRFGCREP
jgi:hypothetical protein